MGIGGVRMQDRFKFRIPMFTDKGSFMEFQYLELGEQEECTLCGYNGEPQQCTGLKDNNGKLIYEGDILGGTYGNLYVHYCDSCKQFQLKAKDYGCMACEGDVHWYEIVESEDENELEVIGNIYQNPELLED
jgi:hypothetical protein